MSMSAQAPSRTPTCTSQTRRESQFDGVPNATATCIRGLQQSLKIFMEFNKTSREISESFLAQQGTLRPVSNASDNRSGLYMPRCKSDTARECSCVLITAPTSLTLDSAFLIHLSIATPVRFLVPPKLRWPYWMLAQIAPFPFAIWRVLQYEKQL
jgi:hypothetical protein